MAIHIFFYVKLDIELVNQKLNKVRANHNDYFDFDFLITEAQVTDEYTKEITEEYRFSPSSLFLMRLNEKNRSGDLKKAVEIVKTYFEPTDILSLHDNQVEY